MIRPDEAIKRLRSDAAAHDFTETAVHYYGDDNKGHGKDLTALLDYVQQLEKKTLLIEDHHGMKVNGPRYLRQERGCGYAFMRREMADHLEEVARRYYAGEITIVDEFLQLYSFGESHRKTLSEKKEPS